MLLQLVVMSDLTKSLSRITSWLENNHPQGYKTLQPGLDWKEIENKISSLQLPNEFYELYQWKNGTRSQINLGNFVEYFFFGANFHALINGRYIDLEESATYYKCIFMFSRDEYCLVLDLDRWKIENLQFPPLAMFFTNTEDPYIEEVVFNNLSNMMLTLAEAMETRACWVANNGDLIGNSARLKLIHQKYNYNCKEGFSKWLDWWLN